MLLLAAAPAQAATRSTHGHRAAVQSSGKASARVVHGAATHAGRASARALTRHAQHDERSYRSKGEDRPSARLRKGTAASRRARNRSDDGRHTARTHSGHKRHGGRHREPPVDEPRPVYRARNDRQQRTPPMQLAESSPVRETHVLGPASRPLPSSNSTGNGIPGNVARNRARRGGTGARGSQAETDTLPSQPSEDDSLPRNTAPASGNTAAPGPTASAQRPRPLAFGRPAPGPIAILTAPTQDPPPMTEVVEGFGAEVDFHGPAPGSGKPTPAATRASLAQQERDLREAAEVASKPMFVPLVTREGKLLVPPPLKGSRDILVHQNQMADDAGLSRIQDDADLARMRRARLLMDFPESGSLRINDGLPENRRCARPWTVQFAVDVARAFYGRFGEALQVNSAVRTVAYQVRLQRVNGNAAAAEGELASPHLTGQALDFGKRGMSVAEIAWMRSYLMPLIDAGKIDVEEEFQQACFHISVYSSYMPSLRRRGPAKTEVAQVTHPTHTRSAGASTADDMQ